MAAKKGGGRERKLERARVKQETQRTRAVREEEKRMWRGVFLNAPRALCVASVCPCVLAQRALAVAMRDTVG